MPDFRLRAGQIGVRARARSESTSLVVSGEALALPIITLLDTDPDTFSVTSTLAVAGESFFYAVDAVGTTTTAANIITPVGNSIPAPSGVSTIRVVSRKAGLADSPVASFDYNPVNSFIHQVIDSFGFAPAPGFQILQTGASFTSVNEALVAATTGQTIIGQPGNYPPYAFGIDRSVTIKSAVPGQLMRFDFPVAIGGGQHICNLFGPNMDVVLEDFEFAGNKVADNYSSGIGSLSDGINLTVRRCLIRDNGNGAVISNAATSGIWVFEDCEFRDNGSYDTHTHHIYAGDITLLAVRGCWFHNTLSYPSGDPNRYKVSWGHLIKARCKAGLIQANRLTMENSEANRCIDIGNGGDYEIRGNLLEYATTQNNGDGQFISFGVEQGINPIAARATSQHKLRVYQNTFVNHSRVNNTADAIWVETDSGIPALTQYDWKDNLFAGTGTPGKVKQDAGVTLYNIDMAQNSVVATTAFVNDAGYDWRLSTPIAGAQNWVPWKYVHPTMTALRTDALRGAAS